MLSRPAYPHDTVTGGCFISGDYSTDEPIVDLELYLETLPPFGRMCISSKGVRMLNRCLGWELMDDETIQATIEMSVEVDRLEAENRALRNSLRKLIDVATLCELVRVAELAGDFEQLEPVR